MLGEFVLIYPEELFLNIMARLGNKLGIINSRLSKMIFGREVTIPVDFPSHLDDLIANLPIAHRFTVDRFINNHTLFPVYQPFLHTEQATRLLDRMARIGPRKKIYQNPRTGPAVKFLRFCYECVQDDRKKHGETFWHRVHQIPGVLICPDHGTVLQNSEIAFTYRSAQQIYVSAEQALKNVKPCPHPFTPQIYQTLLKIAHDADWLLKHHNRHITLESLRNRFRIVLAEKELATYNGMIRVPIFLKEFEACYPFDLLNLLNSTIKYENSHRAWPIVLLRFGAQVGHPFQYLLLIHFLGYTAESFFALPEEVSYFGEERWPCLNPACLDYREPVIPKPKCKVIYRRSDTRPQATFTCSCGFSYSRIGPDTCESDRLRFDHIVAYGPVWEARFEQLYTDPTVTKAEIAQQLHIGASTVKVYIERHKLSIQNGASNPELDNNLTPEVANKRAMWLEARARFPNAPVSELVKDPKLLSLYHWILRHDGIWYKTQRSAVKKRARESQEKYYYTPRYSQNMDLRLSEDIYNAGLLLLDQKERPVRLTRIAILSRLTLKHSHSFSERTPLTLRTVAAVVESYEFYVLRRLEWTAHQLEDQGIPLSKKNLRRASGLGYFFRTKWADLCNRVLEHLLLHGTASPSLVHIFLAAVQTDWPTLDAELCVLVKQAAQHLKERPGYPIKVSIITIGVEIERVELLLRHLEMLPQTRDLLAEVTETDEVFVIRVIEWVVKHDPEIATCSYLQDFIALTGLYPYADIPAISKIISDAFTDWQAQKSAIAADPGIDWSARDEQLAQAIRQAAATIKAQANPLTRVTEKAISKITDNSRIVEARMRRLLSHHLDKLPKTAQAMAEVIETKEQFKQRRLYHVAEQFRQEGIRPSRSDLLYRASIPHAAVSPLLQKTVDEILASLLSFPSVSERAINQEWEQVDLELAKLVEAAARELKEQTDPFIWVTMNSVSKHVGQYCLITSNLDKLPKTAAVLAEVVETAEEFAIRRIKWWEKYYQNKKIKPARYQFLLDVGVEKGKTIHPHIAAAVTSALKNLAVFPQYQRRPREESWSELDIKFSQLIEPTAQILKEQTNPLVQVTVAKVIKYIDDDQLAVWYLKYLPKTVAALAQVVETNEEFALRRVERYGAYFREKQLCPTTADFIVMAGVVPMIRRNSHVRAAVSEMLQALSVFPKYTASQARNSIRGTK